MVFQVLCYFYASYSKVEISVNSTFVVVSLVSASYILFQNLYIEVKLTLATTIIDVGSKI